MAEEINASTSSEPVLTAQSVFGKVRSSWLFRREAPLVSAREVIGWWEGRRIPYNLIVGCAGVVSCISIGVLAAAASMLFNSEFGWPDPPIFVVIWVFVYAIGANACYTGGWIAELILRKVTPRESERIATLCFALGLILSLLLTLTPALVIGAVGFFKLIARLLGHH